MTDSLWKGDEPLWRRWWPALLGPGLMVVVCLLDRAGAQSVIDKPVLEVGGIALTALATACYLYRFLKDRKEMHLVLLLLAGEFLHREFGHNNTVYIVLVIVGAWGVVRFKTLRPQLAVGRAWPWVMCAGWTYFLSQFIARRALRGLPLEQQLHVPWEESMENLAHVMLIVTAFADRLGRSRKDDSPSDGETRPPASGDPQ